MSTEFDIDFIDIALAAGQPAVIFFDECRWCAHTWHGMLCSLDTCRCESSTTSRDDSWRPQPGTLRADKMLTIMHDTGCDGWIANGLVVPIQQLPDEARTGAAMRANRLKFIMYGGGQ